MSDADSASLEPSDLKRVPFLAGLGESEVAVLALAAEVRIAKTGEHVFRQGDPGQELHVVLSGEIVIELDAGGSEPKVLATLSPGAMFGEINFLLASERTADARASIDTRLMVISREALDALEGMGKQAVAKMMETLARILALRLSLMDKEMADFGKKLAEDHPEVAALTAARNDKRSLLLHQWNF